MSPSEVRLSLRRSGFTRPSSAFQLIAEAYVRGMLDLQSCAVQA